MGTGTGRGGPWEGGSRAGVKAMGRQQPRLDQWAPVSRMVVGAGIRRLLRGVRAAGRRGHICYCKEDARSTRGPWSLSVRDGRGWDTASVCVGLRVGRNKTGHCIKGTVQHNL